MTFGRTKMEQRTFYRDSRGSCFVSWSGDGPGVIGPDSPPQSRPAAFAAIVQIQ